MNVCKVSRVDAGLSTCILVAYKLLIFLKYIVVLLTLFFGCWLASKVFIGKLPGMGGALMIIG